MEVRDTEFCALSHARKIAGCFVGGQVTLPSPPTNVRVVPVSGSSAKVTWDEPAKNADRAKMYRVLWRQHGTRLVLGGHNNGKCKVVVQR